MTRQFDVDCYIVAERWLQNNPWNAHDSSHDWLASMQRFGINEDLQQKLMKEQHRTIRQTRDLVYWLEKIVYANWYTLETLDETVSARLDEMASLMPSGVPWFRQQYHVPGSPPVLEGHTAMYKTLLMHNWEFDNRGIFGENGSIDVSNVPPQSSPYSRDLVANKLSFEFTTSKWATDTHAALLRTCIQIPDVRILEIHVPDKHIDAMTKWDFRLDDNDDMWRKLVFYARRTNWFPEEWRKRWVSQEMLIGRMATCGDKDFEKMKSWEEVGEGHVLVDSEGKEVMVFVWKKHRSAKALVEATRGKIYLHRV